MLSRRPVMVSPCFVTGAVIAVLRKHFFIGFEQRALDFNGAAQSSDVAEIGSDARTVRPDAMARGAAAFALEDGLAARGVAVARDGAAQVAIERR